MLQRYSMQAGDLSSTASGLLQSTSGQDIAELIKGFDVELQSMHNVCSTLSGRKALDDLRNIVKTITELEELMDEFGRLVRHLHMLGISTRIESARLGSDGSGFHTLADDVEKLGNRIDGHTTRITQQARSLLELARLAIQQTQEMLQQQEKCSESIFQSIKGNLDSLLNMASSSEGLTESIASSSQDVSQRIGEVVSMLQFHDIVRQQVEHVEEALDDVSGVLFNNSETHLSVQPENADLAGWVADVASIQKLQVQSGKERFVNAVESLKDNLSGIVSSVQVMENEITSLVGQDTAGGTKSLVAIERTVDGMLGTMNDFAVQGEEIGRTMSSVASTVAEISEYLSDIEEVGAEIELIALNASIKAAHTGEQGAAMGVLAMSVQQLSKEASRQTEEVSSLLYGVSDLAGMLKERAAEFLDTSQVQDMVGKLKGLLTNLKTLDGTISSGFSQLVNESSELAQDIAQLTGSIDFHLKVEAQLQEAEDKLAAFEEQAKELAPPSDEQHRPERLKNLLERYTMDAERLVHEQVLNIADGNAATEEDAGDDMDNVELF